MNTDNSLEQQQKLSNLNSIFYRIKSNSLFEMVVTGIIILSGMLIGIETYEEAFNPDFIRILSTLDFGITVFFVIELLIRFFSEPRKSDFFKSGWNLFDTFIIFTSLIPISYAQTIILARLLRIFRTLRIISVIPELRLLINALLKTIPQLFYVTMLMFIIFYIYGALGSTLFHSINEERWGNISISMLTLFQIMTFEAWTDIMYETMNHQNGHPFTWIYYLSFICLTAFTFLNMIIGIVVNAMEEEHRKIKTTEDESEELDIKQLQKDIQELKALLINHKSNQ